MMTPFLNCAYIIRIERVCDAFGSCCSPNGQFQFCSSKESGYIRLVNGQSVVIMDVGDVGLSFCLHMHTPTRLAWRATQSHNSEFWLTLAYLVMGFLMRDCDSENKAHNTVCFEDINSSEVWSGFRVARRADALNIVTKFNSKVSKVQAAHNGYVD